MSIQTQTNQIPATVPLAAILPSQANPRRDLDKDALEGLAESIAQDGLLQNLVVARSRGKQVRLISGERRYRALQLLAERGTIDADFPVPVEIRSKLSGQDKLRLATIENVQRQDLPPLDEAEAFAALLRNGTDLEDLAAKTGLSAKTIKRRLVLNDLCAEAQKALRDGAITLAQAEALTLGDHDRQRDVLDDLAQEHCDYSAAAIRDWMIDERPSVAMAVFPMEQYTGTLTTDLFGEAETSYFDDAEQFMALQRQAVEALAASYGESAAWVTVTENYSLQLWAYREAEDGEDDQAGVLINLSPSGRVDIREGLIRPERSAAEEAAADDHPAAPSKPRPAYSGPLRRLIAWRKSAAIQELLLADPRKAREVAVTAKLDGFRPHEAITQLSRQDEPGISCDTLETQAWACAGWLGFELDESDSVWKQFPPYGTDERDLYEAVRALSDHQLAALDTLLSALSFGQEFCDRLDTGDSLFNRVARDLGADMRDHWRPDRQFFEKRTGAQLLEIAQECGCADLHGIGRLRTYKKSELIGSLLRHFDLAFSAAEPNEAQQKARQWLPEAMLFPAVDPNEAPADEGLAEAA